MPVTVTPDTFSIVSFDAATIATVTATVAEMLGIDRPVAVEVDETTPIARVRVDIGATITLHICSGALENNKWPLTFSESAATRSIGAALLRARDRLSGGFGEAPADADLALRQVAAWSTYALGRLSRLGVRVNQQRVRYDFRNRHGFADRVDATFDRIWSSDTLTWGELDAMSAEAAGER